MNGIGIVRRVDYLGRIVLPKEIRRKLGINEGTPMEIYASADSVTIKSIIQKMNYQVWLPIFKKPWTTCALTWDLKRPEIFGGISVRFRIF